MKLPLTLFYTDFSSTCLYVLNKVNSLTEEQTLAQTVLNYFLDIVMIILINVALWCLLVDFYLMSKSQSTTNEVQFTQVLLSTILQYFT